MNFQECQNVSCPKATKEKHREEKDGGGGGGEKESEQDGRCMGARPSNGDKEIIHHVSERLR